MTFEEESQAVRGLKIKLKKAEFFISEKDKTIHRLREELEAARKTIQGLQPLRRWKHSGVIIKTVAPRQTTHYVANIDYERNGGAVYVPERFIGHRVAIIIQDHSRHVSGQKAEAQ